MSRIIFSLLAPGKHIVFHSAALAIITTGIVMLLSASELGPVSAFIVPLGLYAVILGVFSELFFGVRSLISVCAQYVQNRSCNTEAKAQ